MKTLARCPVCENTRFTTVIEQPDAVYFPRTIVKCETCGLLFVNPQPTEDELAKAYNEEIYLNENIQSWDRKQRKYTSIENSPAIEPPPASSQELTPEIAATPVFSRAIRRTKTIATLARPGASILDIGCRGGEFLYIAGQSGFNPSGVEISAENARLAQANTGHEVFPGSLDQFAANRPQNSPLFDIVTIWDVVEHLTDPVSTLKLANSLLNKNGLLCLSTVNLSNYRYLMYKNNWRGFAEGQEHTLFFSPRSLGLLLRKSGFKPVRIITRSIPPVLLKWLNIFKLGHELEAYAVKTHDA